MKLCYFQETFSVPYADIRITSDFVIWYVIMVMGASQGAFLYFLMEIYFVSVCVHIAACLKDLRFTLESINEK